MSADSPVQRPQPTRILPRLMERLETREPMVVLDLGAARPETVSFFSGYRCRLHVVGLLEAMTGTTPSPDDKDGWRQWFEQAVALPGDTRIDLCLLWDLGNYLDDGALAALGQYLAPFVDNETLAHGFAAMNPRKPIGQREYGIVGPDRFSQRPRTGDAPAPFQRSQGALEQLLPLFNVERSVLHGDGLVELSLKGS